MFKVTTNASPLRASQRIVLPPYSVPLPQNQWELEVELWYQTSLARLQIVQHASTSLPAWVTETFDVIPRDSPEGRRQCSTQRRLLPAGYQTHSVFGLVFTAAVGLFSVVSATVIREFHGTLLPYRRRGEKHHDKYLAFMADGQLQLHRAALQGAGFDGWVEDANSEEVPYTRYGSRRLPVAVLAKVISSDKSQPNPSLRKMWRHYYQKTTTWHRHCLTCTVFQAVPKPTSPRTGSFHFRRLVLMKREKWQAQTSFLSLEKDTRFLSLQNHSEDRDSIISYSQAT